MDYCENPQTVNIEMFMESYCVAGKKPIVHKKNKP